MNKISAIIVLCSIMILAACGNQATTANSSGGHAGHKPSLDVQWKVEGRTLFAEIITDMHISPEHFGQARKTGEGHIHLYLDDGEKIVATYSHIELKDLPSGAHTLKVSLHNNDHTPYDVTKTIQFDIP